MNTQQQQGTQQGGTGASNLEYNLISELHELLEGNAALDRYIQDAQQAGDREAEQCFQRICENNRESVATLRALLMRCLGNGQQQQQQQQQQRRA